MNKIFTPELLAGGALCGGYVAGGATDGVTAGAAEGTLPGCAGAGCPGTAAPQDAQNRAPSAIGFPQFAQNFAMRILRYKSWAKER